MAASDGRHERPTAVATKRPATARALEPGANRPRLASLRRLDRPVEFRTCPSDFHSPPSSCATSPVRSTARPAGSPSRSPPPTKPSPCSEAGPNAAAGPWSPAPIRRGTSGEDGRGGLPGASGRHAKATAATGRVPAALARPFGHRKARTRFSWQVVRGLAGAVPAGGPVPHAGHHVSTGADHGPARMRVRGGPFFVPGVWARASAAHLSAGVARVVRAGRSD